MTFAQFGKLPTAKRAKFFKSLSEDDQYNLKAAMLHYGLREEKEKMNKKTIRELIAEGKEIRDRMRDALSE